MTPALLLPLPVFALEWSCDGEAVSVWCAPWARTERIRERSKRGWTNTQRRVQERVCKKIPLAPWRREQSPPGRKSWLLLSHLVGQTQAQIAAIALNVILLRADLRVVAERSVATEQQVTCMQSDMDTLKASVAILEAKTLRPS
ncbi:hypothetical protein NDU88_005472 [Pleurodeles waltl]|uniref:Uncharacterized protein n=1 Tax=Pleurodeles waltl TaxID=8319 RepID=A0AAV7TU23_PLEWA|nr:hypothetical protein NDU88_005472 [Pleurodeles waltl]